MGNRGRTNKRITRRRSGHFDPANESEHKLCLTPQWKGAVRILMGERRIVGDLNPFVALSGFWKEENTIILSTSQILFPHIIIAPKLQ